MRAECWGMGWTLVEKRKKKEDRPGKMHPTSKKGRQVSYRDREEPSAVFQDPKPGSSAARREKPTRKMIWGDSTYECGEK